MEMATNGRSLLQQAAEKQKRMHENRDESSTLRLSAVLPVASAPQVVAQSADELAAIAAEKAARESKWEAEQAERWRLQRIEDQKADRKRRLGLLADQIGKKYMTKDLTEREFYGSEADQAKQRTAFAKVDEFIANMKTGVDAGKNLLLVGSRGTGKDFCLANCLRLAIWRYGFAVKWMDGSRLFLNLRDSMNKHAAKTEAQIIYDLSDFPIVALSDPMPAMGNITEFQASILLSIVDARYRNDRPTWMTLNVSSRKEAEQRMGAMLVDRLFENSEVIFFDWPSYREHTRAVSVQK